MTEFAKQHHVDGADVPAMAKPRMSPPRELYIPKLHNPPAPVRPGAEDNKRYKSLEDKGTAAVYPRHHP